MFFVILLVVLFSKSEGKFYNGTVNATDLTRCKVHYSRSESLYKEFYEIADETHSNGTILDFHFSVLAPSDAHILFATKMKIDKTDPAYEVVLGAGGNMFSDIRRQQKSAVKASVRIKNLLNALDPQSFWIHISKDGLIEVGREGVELAFITWKDSDPLPIKYFSFGTWLGVEAKWYFDCPREDNSTGDSKEVKKPLTHVERLRLDLLPYYDPYVRPVIDPLNTTIVKMEMVVNYLTLDEHKSAMTIKGRVKLTWLDEKMKWTPEDYGNITLLHVIGREIWQPDLELYNAIDISGRDILDQFTMTVTNKGVVEWNPSTRMEVWCDATDLSHWPNDIHNCHVLLGLSTTLNNVELKLNKSQITGSLYKTEWTVLEAKVGTFHGPWLDDYQRPHLKITFRIRRNSNVYSAVFFTPFLVIAVSMLATFCVSPSGYLKISLGCFQLILTSLMMVTLAGFIPTHPDQVPYLVNLYSYSLIASVILIILSIVVVNLSRLQYKTNMPFRIWTVLTSKSLQWALLLPKFTKSENYGKLNDGTASIKSDEAIINCWEALGVIIDRISFIIYFALIMYALAARY